MSVKRYKLLEQEINERDSIIQNTVTYQMGRVDPLLEFSTSLRKIKSPVFVPNIYGVHVYNTRIVLPSKITTLETLTCMKSS